MMIAPANLCCCPPQTREASQSVEGIGPAIDPDRPIDFQRIEAAVREVLLALGEDPGRDGLLETPKRVAKAYSELLSGTRQDPELHLRRVFESDHDGIVLLRDIPFSSLCEHHMLPFWGKATVAYRPQNRRVVGLSKIARTVESFARRLQLQERLTNQVVDAIVAHLNPEGAAVIVRAEHMCMRMRGIRSGGSEMLTTAYRGCFAADSRERADLHAILAI